MIRTVAGPLGYRGKAGLFWRKGNELTTMVRLQKSRWDGGVYVVFGVIPNEFLFKEAPPPSAYWPLQERGESFDSLHRPVFEALASDKGNELDKSTLHEAFAWLFGWIRDNISEESAFRAAFGDPNSWLMRRGPMSEGILGDWSRGQLKDPGHYYKG